MRNQKPVLSAAVLAALLAGCATTPESQFYVLQPRAWNAPASKKVPGKPTTIGLQPVTLPDYLDRPQIVTGKGSVGIHVAEFHRWGEPLGSGMARVLRDTLKTCLTPHTIPAFPWGDTRPDLQIKISVNTFIATPGAKATLVADCRLIDREGNGTLHTFSTERPAGTDYTSIVQTMSALVDDLGRMLAEKIIENGNDE